MQRTGPGIFSRPSLPSVPVGRRRFLATGLAFAGAACGGTQGSGGSAGPTAGATPPSWAAFTDTIDDLLTGRPIASGRIAIPGAPSIEVRDGRYAVTAAHRLEVGSQRFGVVIEGTGCVTRRTGALVTASGLRVDLGYRSVPLDLVGDPALYDRWLATRVRRILERWDPRLYRGALLFDRQLYDSGRLIDGYDVEPTFLAAVERVAGSEIARMTGGALRDGLSFASDVPRPAWPDPVEPSGWLVFYTATGLPDWADPLLSAPRGDDFGVVHGGFVEVRPLRRTSVAEVLAATRDAVGRYLRGTVPAAPASLADAFAAIQYGRKIGQRVSDVPDDQD